MKEEIANLVHPTVRYALALRERLEHGAALSLEVEQAALKGMLLTDYEARRWIDFGGETLKEKAIEAEDSGERSETFLGIRYALTCWLDELFILYSPWESLWNERKLEVALYGTNDRAWKFWDQARRAETRPGSDALEVFYLCVMLGFRGELLEAPEKLRSWRATTQARLGQVLAQDWQAPPELEPFTNVPPLRARERLQRMVLAGSMALLFLIPVVVFFAVRYLGQ